MTDTHVDFSYSFAPPHRLTVGCPEDSHRTLLDLEPGGLRLSWTYDDLTDTRRYPLATFKAPTTPWELHLSIEIDGDKIQDSRWSRIDGWIPALDNVYADPRGRVALKVFGCRTAAVADIQIQNLDAQPHRFVLICERPGGLTGYNPAWVDPTTAPGDHLLAGWAERADRVTVLGTGAQAYSLEASGRPPGATILLMAWDLAAGETAAGQIVRPYEAYQADLDLLRRQDWHAEIAAARAEWQHLIERAATPRIPDRGVADAFRACLADLFIMREPVGAGYIAAVPGTEVYRAPNPVEPAIVAIALDQLGLHAEADYGYRLPLDLQEADGDWSEPKGWGHLVWCCSGFKAWMILEHYRHTGDSAYLREMFPRLAASARFQYRQRERMRFVPGAIPGLMPPGMGDCGLMDEANYYGTFLPHNIWAVYADRLALEAGRSLAALGELDDPGILAELEDISAVGARDLLAALDLGAIQADGYRWIPGVSGKTCGSRWGALNVLFPTHLLPPEHELVTGTMRKLEEHISPGGHPVHTGWMEDGCWIAITLDNLAENHLVLGNGDAAARYFYATLNHATPLLTWCEERGQEPLTPKTSGDRQHLWTPVAVVRCLRDMLVMEAGDTLHLALGADRAWLASGQPLGIERASTHFGEITYHLTFDPTARKVTGRIDFARREQPEAIRIHLRLPESWSASSVTSTPGANVAIKDQSLVWHSPEESLAFEITLD
jgi:hypothetical protein